jgi:hypothetical protein
MSGIILGAGITVGAGVGLGAGISPPSPGTNNVTGYTEMPPPVTAGGDLEDVTATINGSTGFTINNDAATGIAIQALSVSNQTFFSTYGTGSNGLSCLACAIA